MSDERPSIWYSPSENEWFMEAISPRETYAWVSQHSDAIRTTNAYEILDPCFLQHLHTARERATKVTPDETREWLNAPCVCGHARGVHGCWHARMQVVCTCSEFQAATERTSDEKFAVDPGDGAHPEDLRAINSSLRTENLALRADLSALKGEK